MNIDQINRVISSIEIDKPGPVSNPREKCKEDKLKEACKGFESIFLYYLMKNMRESIPQSDLLGGGLGGEYFRGLFDEVVAKAVSKGNGIGLSEMLYRSLSLRETEMSLRTKDVRSTTPIPGSQSEVPDQDREILDRVKKFNPIIKAAAKQYVINSRLIQAVIAQESGGNPEAVSPKGAKGLMQLMDETAGDLGLSDVKDPRENIFGGARYLKGLLDRFEGDVRLALAAYNAGPGAVERHGGIPPYGETRAFVENVMRYFRISEQIS